MKTTNNQLRAHISERSAQLRHIAAELKTELFGIDDIIDRVIDTIRAWYVLPDIINRPVIVNLWGLTVRARPNSFAACPKSPASMTA